MKGLLDIIGPVEMTDYCSSRNYRRWEDEIAAPRLRELGYEDIRWFDGERDSFGPLSRIASAVKDNTIHRFVYG